MDLHRCDGFYPGSANPVVAEKLRRLVQVCDTMQKAALVGIEGLSARQLRECFFCLSVVVVVVVQKSAIDPANIYIYVCMRMFRPIIVSAGFCARGQKNSGNFARH